MSKPISPQELKKIIDKPPDKFLVLKQFIEENVIEEKEKEFVDLLVRDIKNELRLVSYGLDHLMNQFDPLQMLSVDQVCSKLLIHRNSLMPWIRFRALPHTKIGERYLISRENLKTFEKMTEGINLPDPIQIEQFSKNR